MPKFSSKLSELIDLESTLPDYAMFPHKENTVARVHAVATTETLITYETRMRRREFLMAVLSGSPVSINAIYAALRLHKGVDYREVMMEHFNVPKPNTVLQYSITNVNWNMRFTVLINTILLKGYDETSRSIWTFSHPEYSSEEHMGFAFENLFNLQLQHGKYPLKPHWMKPLMAEALRHGLMVRTASRACRVYFAYTYKLDSLVSMMLENGLLSWDEETKGEE